ncbi:putative Mobilization protein MobB [Thiomonas sp. X19]|uniref:plasmid mobilization protein n=1 Tax=Thiomonas sp. X19 TaxID=1050370 RepID=UPI000B704F13|nr:hypothetical protein [Thiomonas sp. X19]SCC94659.1 putative Mobilization protein MobB [Thiomonas sp. X19]
MPAAAKPPRTPHTPRDRFFHFRASTPEIDAINRHAAQAGMRPGVFVRDLALSGGNLRLVSRVDASAVFELRRLGAMLKSLYPKESNWTNEEKRAHWAAMKTVLAHARKLSGEDDAGGEQAKDA